MSDDMAYPCGVCGEPKDSQLEVCPSCGELDHDPATGRRIEEA